MLSISSCRCLRPSLYILDTQSLQTKRRPAVLSLQVKQWQRHFTQPNQKVVYWTRGGKGKGKGPREYRPTRKAPTSKEVLEGSPSKTSESNSNILPINLPNTKEGQRLKAEVIKYWVENIIRADPTGTFIPLQYRMQVLNRTYPLKLDVDSKATRTTVYMRGIRFAPGEEMTRRLCRAAGHTQTEKAGQGPVYILTFLVFAIFVAKGFGDGKGN